MNPETVNHQQKHIKKEKTKLTEITHLCSYFLALFSFSLVFAIASSLNEKIKAIYEPIYAILAVFIVINGISYFVLLHEKQLEFKPIYVNKYTVIASISFLLSILYQS